MRAIRSLLWLAFLVAGGLAAEAGAAPVDFDLPAQPADQALLAFSRQSAEEVLFSYDDLHWVRSTAVLGRHEPEAALELLLQGTGFAARRNHREKFVVARAPTPLRSAPAEASQAEASEPIRLDPVIVEDQAERQRRSDRDRSLVGDLAAGGNLDLPRTEDDVLPFTIYHRDQIVRSGVVDLNQYLQRELLESAAATPVPSGNSLRQFLFAGAKNLNLRGYGNDETVILVNGRRLPNVVIMNADPTQTAPDVSLIPLSLVERIEVMPISASALYSGNPVGGVINIVLRSGLPAHTRATAQMTEVTSTYATALRGFDAPQSTISFLHGESLLGGALHLRLSASFTQAMPPTETELRFHQARRLPAADLTAPVYGATPNIRSADGLPLFGPGTSSVTSVAPGTDGSGGLGLFLGRQGVLDQALYHLPGGWSTSPDSRDYAYGQRLRRAVYYGAADYTVSPRLHLGLDGSYARTVVNPGYDILTADLALGADSPLNPFGRDVRVAVNEAAPQLGPGYGEAQIEFYSGILGAVLKLPGDWRLDLDGQLDHSLAKYRGLVGADPGRWQQLVDQGLYNPLRDTQRFAPPAAFYDRVLIYEGGRGRFATVGNYNTLDLAVRATNPTLSLPMGSGTVNLGGDYRRDRFDDLAEEPVYGDGSPAEDPIRWRGRTLQAYSAFGELQAPLVPSRLLPAWLRQADVDLAARYDADSSRESNLAPTFGLRLGLPAGFTLRGSATTSTRYPTPILSRQASSGTMVPGGGPSVAYVFDPLRNQNYDVAYTDVINPVLRAEGTVTEAAGVIFEQGHVHRLRLALDFADTRKNNEAQYLDAGTVVELESLLPGRVTRSPPAPGDTHAVGPVTSVLTGAANFYLRHSRNWNASLEYTWTDCAGGTLELYGRLVYFTRYDRQILSTSPMVDELRHPDNSAPDLLKCRVNFGAGWSDQAAGFGVDGHYFGSRVLPAVEWASQGADRIASFWQFDAYLQKDFSRWLPGKNPRCGLRGQARVNNVFGADFPFFANDQSGAGVQPYGDWRGRTYSLSITVTF